MGFVWEAQSPVDSEEVVPFDSVCCRVEGRVFPVSWRDLHSQSLLLTSSLCNPLRPLTRPGPEVIITNTIWSSLYMPALGAKLSESFQRSCEAQVLLLNRVGIQTRVGWLPGVGSWLPQAPQHCVYYFTKTKNKTSGKENSILSYRQIYKLERAILVEWWEQKPAFQGLKCEWVTRRWM